MPAASLQRQQQYNLKQKKKNQKQNIALNSAVSPNLLINLKDKPKQEYTAEC